jgi:hypothetical protein
MLPLLCPVCNRLEDLPDLLLDWLKGEMANRLNVAWGEPNNKVN